MAARLTGELKTWHKTTLEFVSDVTFKEDTSTFRDYRLDVTFTHANTGKTITVPGFFAADGKAADSNATSGKIWQVNFNAPLDGKWSYDASFRTGNDIAASTAAKAGKAVGYIDGESGTFRIAKTDKSGEDFRAKGMIVQDEGTHYLQHQGDGDYFVRGGPGIPENFLATSDIDNTVGTLDYKTHSSDFDKGGPTWDGGKGKNLIGAIDYLAEQGQNSDLPSDANGGRRRQGRLALGRDRPRQTVEERLEARSRHHLGLRRLQARPVGKHLRPHGREGHLQEHPPAGDGERPASQWRHRRRRERASAPSG